VFLELGAYVFAIYAARIDFRFRILPNSLTTMIAALGVAQCSLTGEFPQLIYWVFTLSHLFMSVLIPSAFGMGDVKLLAGVGLFFEDSGGYLTWLMLSYLSGLSWGLFQRVRTLAFGPHLVLAWIACSMGDYAYVSILNCR
jgi:prepilin signal peptidase PulO-like enzyme (type II secretory pathway)